MDNVLYEVELVERNLCCVELLSCFLLLVQPQVDSGQFSGCIGMRLFRFRLVDSFLQGFEEFCPLFIVYTSLVSYCTLLPQM